MADWQGFLEGVKKEPKNFAKAVVDHLNPPKYAIEQLKKFDWMCDLCWKPQADVCMNCHRGICEEHIAKTFVGEKTKLECYVCPECLKTVPMDELTAKVEQEDEEIWLEDQEEETK